MPYFKGWLQGLEIPVHRIEAPELSGPLRILVLSDLHFHSGIGEAGVDALTAVMRRLCAEQRPGLILFAGDFIDHDGGLPLLERFASALDPSPPKLAVLGNHDLFEYPLWHLLFFPFLRRIRRRAVDTQAIRSILRSGGIELLENGTAMLELGMGRVAVTGIDPRVRMEGLSLPPLPARGSAGFRIALSHYPVLASSCAECDLFIAGHSHGGLFRACGKARGKGAAGEAAAGGLFPRNGGHILVTRGLGSSREIPFRFGINPDIRVIILSPRD